MTPAERKRALNGMMRARKMTARQVGDLVGVQPKTVRNWRSSSDRGISAQTWELLQLKIAAGSDA